MSSDWSIFGCLSIHVCMRSMNATQNTVVNSIQSGLIGSNSTLISNISRYRTRFNDIHASGPHLSPVDAGRSSARSEMRPRSRQWFRSRRRELVESCRYGSAAVTEEGRSGEHGMDRRVASRLGMRQQEVEVTMWGLRPEQITRNSGP